MTDWHRVDNQPAMTGHEMKTFLTNYSNNLVKGLEMDMIGGSGSAKKQAYCMKCRKKQNITNATLGKNARNVGVLKGSCASCNTKVSVFVSAKNVKK